MLKPAEQFKVELVQTKFTLVNGHRLLTVRQILRNIAEKYNIHDRNFSELMASSP